MVTTVVWWSSSTINRLVMVTWDHVGAKLSASAVPTLQSGKSGAVLSLTYLLQSLLCTTLSLFSFFF